MTTELRHLNEDGMRAFSDWIVGGASGAIPLNLLTDPSTSEPLGSAVTIAIDPMVALKDRYELGIYLGSALTHLEPSALAHDRGVWTALSLLLFDRLCPIKGNGKRSPVKSYHYVLSTDYRHHYRHLLRSPWQLVRDHGEHSKFLLLASQEGKDELGRHGDILEQFGGRQAALRSAALVREASSLYSDPATKRPLRGVAGNRGGSVRRLGLVLRQLDLTYDADAMGDGALETVLPKEFDRWKPKEKEEKAA